VALGSEQDLHTAHWHGETVVEDGRRRTDDVELLPGSMKVADMKADNPGTWLFHCHVSDHMMGGMYAFYVIHPK
jgi:FtsP/CotA-like multicopper oxidase with cupredoxin domain